MNNQLDLTKKNFGMNKLIKLTSCSLKDIQTIDDIKGIPFIGIKKENETEEHYIIKIIPVIKSIPVLSEIEIFYSKLLSEEFLKTNLTPCIPAYLHSYDKVPNESPCLIHKLPYKGINKIEEIEDWSHVLETEFISDLDIIDLFENYKVTDSILKSILFQIIYTISVFQDKLKLVHGDLHLCNILLCQKTEEYKFFKYTYKDQVFYPKSYGFIPKIIDYECMECYIEDSNLKIPQIISEEDKETYDRHIDMHFFLKELLKIDILPQETRTFIESIYPLDLIDIKEEQESYKDSKTFECETHYILNGRLKEEIGDLFDLPIPEKILEHSYFEEYKKAPPLKLILEPEYKYK